MANGRRILIYIAAALTLCAVLFMSVIQHPDMHHPGAGLAYFCFGRLLIGLAVGFYSSVIPSYINEVSPTHLTGVFGSCHQLFVTFAIVITSIIGLVLPEGSPHELQQSMSWRLAFGFPAILSAIQVLLIIFVFTDDSPVYYASKGMWQEV